MSSYHFTLYTIRMEHITKILETVDLTWFTALLTWDEVKRYVVWLTDNHTRSLELLEEQFERFSKEYKNLTIGGRTNQNGEVIVDIWTSTDSMYTAIKLWIKYNQDAIRDDLEKREV